MDLTIPAPQIMAPEEGTWVARVVLAPKEIPPAYAQCPCQGISNACKTGEHHRCGHEQWIAWGPYHPEAIIGRGHGPFPCRGSFGLNVSKATVYLADRRCRTRCNCHCHQPPPEPTPAPAGAEQLDLLQEEF
jgi:hypothetical protein